MGVVSVYSPDWDEKSGYGRKSLELAKHLGEVGYHVNKMGFGAPADLIKPVAGGFMLGYPTMREEYGGLLNAGPVIAQTMFESTVLPAGWIENLNQCAGVAVPSRWLVDVMRANGLRSEIPVEVVPEGISESFVFVHRRKYPKVFTFLALADRGARKNWVAAVRAFVMAFGDSDRHRLIIKTREEGLPGLGAFTNRNIELVKADYSEDEMMALYARCHAMVFPSYGEGFGLPPREFAATGGAAICTNWSGLADDLPGWGFPVKFKLVQAWEGHPKFEGLGQWAEVDLAHLAKQMEYVASEGRWRLWAWGGRTDTGMRFDARSKRVAAKARKLYDWRKFAEGMAKFWQEVTESRAPRTTPTIAERRQLRRERRSPA